MWAVIATWQMAYEGTKIAADALKNHDTAKHATLIGCQNVEMNPEFHSVGYGGLPDEEGHVCMDGGFMDGDTLHYGAIGYLEGFASVAEIAQSLCEGDANNFLVGEGARQYALHKGFKELDNLTDEAKQTYLSTKKAPLKAYDGHDTVCFVALDKHGTIATTTSTSGLFMKKKGRIGDTPLPGNGFYADSEIGGAAATGNGEEICKGALSYTVVSMMEQGMSVQEACQKAVDDLNRKLIKKNGYALPMSVIGMDKNGNFGVGTNIDFTFCIASENTPLTLYEAKVEQGALTIRKQEHR